ncbi:MAG: hypothetical protein E7202_01475 [Selenomonas ruminantium]|jgi:hypothetical protein|nr:hypothetical protein [Selenomonas ruminantium]
MNEKKDNVETYDPIEMIRKVIDKIINIAFKSNIKELAEIYSKDIDNIILKSERDKSFKYVGGEFIVTYVTERIFSIKIALYYKNKEDKWVEESYVTSRDMKLLKDEAVIELKESKKIIYEIEYPKVVNIDFEGKE